MYVNFAVIMKEYQEIGSISKTFGLKGQLKLKVADNYLPILLKQKIIYLLEGSAYIPFFIEQLDNGTQLSVKLEEVDSKEVAVKLSGKAIFLPQEAIGHVEEEASDLTFDWAKGYLIIDTDQEPVGDIIDVVAYPQQEIAVVDYKGKEIMIPLNEKLVIGLDEEEKIMMMDIPEGLLEM